MPDEQDPPRKFYEFKPKAFDVVNRPPTAPDAPTPISVQDHLAQAAGRPPAGRRPPMPTGPSGAIDVAAILRDNLARANAAGLNKISEAPVRRSRRKRDYWIAMIAGNVFFGLCALIGALGRNPMLFVSGLAGMAILSAGLTWVMWHLMEDY